jgi:hypothetical protein
MLKLALTVRDDALEGAAGILGPCDCDAAEIRDGEWALDKCPACRIRALKVTP